MCPLANLVSPSDPAYRWAAQRRCGRFSLTYENTNIEYQFIEEAGDAGAKSMLAFARAMQTSDLEQIIFMMTKGHHPRATAAVSPKNKGLWHRGIPQSLASPAYEHCALVAKENLLINRKTIPVEVIQHVGNDRR